MNFIDGLKGKVWERGPTWIILNVENTGFFYKIEIPAYSDELLSEGSQAHIFTYVFRNQQEEFVMFGFLSREERNLFERLLKIQGVGISIARNILSTYSPSEFVAIVSGEDIESLKDIKGIGERLANRIIYELKPDFDLRSEQANSSLILSAIKALEMLGLSRREARKLVKKAIESGMKDVQQVVTKALQLRGIIGSK